MKNGDVVKYLLAVQRYLNTRVYRYEKRRCSQISASGATLFKYKDSSSAMKAVM